MQRRSVTLPHRPARARRRPGHRVHRVLGHRAVQAHLHLHLRLRAALVQIGAGLDVGPGVVGRRAAALAPLPRRTSAHAWSDRRRATRTYRRVHTGAIGLTSPLITSEVGTGQQSLRRCTVSVVSPGGTVSAGPGTVTGSVQAANAGGALARSPTSARSTAWRCRPDSAADRRRRGPQPVLGGERLVPGQAKRARASAAAPRSSVNFLVRMMAFSPVRTTPHPG